MVVTNGNFSVRLVEAETKTPFKEHNNRDGKFYTEVEPGVEYFVEVEVLNTGSYKDWVYVELFVDGDYLGYYYNAWPGEGSQYKGAWEYKDGVSTMTALRFNKPTIKREDAKDKAATLMGTVSVTFYQAIYQGKVKRSSNARAISSCIAPPSEGGAIAAKSVRSEEGSVSISEQLPPEVEDYSRGQHLETVTIHYCTTPGLICAGILPKPPLRDCARQSLAPVDPRLANIMPTIIHEEATTDGDGSILRPARDFEVFDLTHIN